MRRTQANRWSIERAPAGTPGGDADVAGGWLPSLTLAFDNPEAGIQYKKITIQIRQDNRMTG
jgi:hypothetical protein